MASIAELGKGLAELGASVKKFDQSVKELGSMYRTRWFFDDIDAGIEAESAARRQAELQWDIAASWESRWDRNVAAAQASAWNRSAAVEAAALSSHAPGLSLLERWQHDPTTMFENTLTASAEYSLALLPVAAPARLAGLAARGAGFGARAEFGLGANGATRALRLPTTDMTLAGTRTLGYTTPNGNVFLQSGLSRAEQLSTLRHESVHAFFSPRGSGPVATFRQNFGQWGYDNSQLLRFTEEAIAETYGSGSLLRGLRHPFVNGYVSPGGVLLEGGGLIGAGYLGHQLGTGN